MGISTEVGGQLVVRFRVLFPHLNERQQRLALGQEARLLGHGGVRAVARAAGVSETTVRAGVFELEAGEDPLPDGRVRRPGGGRRAAGDLDPDLVPALLALAAPDGRGDPMSALRWTTRSLRNLAGELTRQGYPVSAPTVGRLPQLVFPWLVTRLSAVLGDAMNLPNLWIFLGALLGSGLSVYLVHRYWAQEKRREHTDVAGFIFAGVAVLYAVLLAFVVIMGWETLSSAHATTYTEADQLSNVYWIARSLPAPQGPAVEDLALKYAHTVVNKEWPLMNEGKSSPEAQNLLTQIRAKVFRFSPRTDQQQVLYEQAVVSVNGLTAARRDRLDAMTEEVPEPIWVALIFGAVIVIAFCLLFGVKSRAVHIGMVLAIAALITICLILIKDMQYPFAGNPHVGPEAFEVFLRAIPSSH